MLLKNKEQEEWWTVWADGDGYDCHNEAHCTLQCAVCAQQSLRIVMVRQSAVISAIRQLLFDWCLLSFLSFSFLHLSAEFLCLISWWWWWWWYTVLAGVGWLGRLPAVEKREGKGGDHVCRDLVCRITALTAVAEGWNVCCLSFLPLSVCPHLDSVEYSLVCVCAGTQFSSHLMRRFGVCVCVLAIHLGPMVFGAFCAPRIQMTD